MDRGAERAGAMRAFLEDVGWGAAEFFPLPGDASTRRYVRVALNGRTAMLMDQPQNAEDPPCSPDATPDERRAMGYNAVARLAGADCARFIAAAEYLRAHGLSAPEIYAADTPKGLVLIEDLGDDLFADVVARDGNERVLYGAAVDSLARLQTEPAPSLLSCDKPLYAYDETALLAEIDLMTDWFMPLALGRKAHAEEVEDHRALWRSALRHVLAEPPVFVHRDFHAQNLMWLPDRKGEARVGVIDFQDAVAGTRSYDLISLIEDARRDVSDELAREMTDRYLDARQAHGADLDRDALRAEMALMAAQRNTKIAGIFARLYSRDGKPRYLGYLPRVWRHLERDLEHLSLGQLKSWYDKTIPKEVRSIVPLSEAAA
jgi:aminoglycoside/choline kinase family phosphotransferase